MSSGFGADRLGWTDQALIELRGLRGWTEDALERLEVRYDPASGIVGIPIRDATAFELGHVRYLPRPEQRNGRRKMAQPGGVPRQLFPPPESFDNGVRELLLTEGEPDTIAATSARFNAIGVPGTAGWRDQDAARFTGRPWRVYVTFDCDEPGRTAAARIAASLIAAGVDARIVDLDPARDDGYDLTDFLLERGGLELHRRLELAEPRTPPPAVTPAAFTIQTLEAFAAVDEPGARELVGEPGQALIPAGANVMLYGNGGAGKTTLCVDLACHLAAGDDWLEITIAAAGRSLIVEDEGPRAFFRRKLERKLEAWHGSPLDGRVLVVEEPWATFTFADETHRHALAAAVVEHELDVVIVGPIVVAGMEKAGTLQDVREFLHLVDGVRRIASRDVTFVLVHHENKGGEVSGAWEGAGDTLLHLSAQGHGKTRLHIQKARQAPEYHLETLILEWADGEGYTVVEGKAQTVTDDELDAKLLAAIASSPGLTWTAVEDKTKGVKSDRRRAARDRLLELGTIVNLERRKGANDVALAYCDKGKPAHLYLADDEAIRHLLPALRRSDEHGLF